MRRRVRIRFPLDNGEMEEYPGLASASVRIAEYYREIALLEVYEVMENGGLRFLMSISDGLVLESTSEDAEDLYKDIRDNTPPKPRDPSRAFHAYRKFTS